MPLGLWSSLSSEPCSLRGGRGAGSGEDLVQRMDAEWLGAKMKFGPSPHLPGPKRTNLRGN